MKAAVIGFMLMTFFMIGWYWDDIFHNVAGEPSSLPVQVKAWPARGADRGHIDYAVPERWNCQRVVFTAGFDGELKQVEVVGKNKAWTITPGAISVSGGGKFSPQDLDWKVWEDRFALVKSEVATMPSGSQPATQSVEKQ